MLEKRVKTRVILKHDFEKNWEQAKNFYPEKGEIIIYDREANKDGDIIPAAIIEGTAGHFNKEGRTAPFTYERFKIGDGVSNVNLLEFATDFLSDTINEVNSNTADKIGQIDFDHGVISGVNSNDSGVHWNAVSQLITDGTSNEFDALFTVPIKAGKDIKFVKDSENSVININNTATSVNEISTIDTWYDSKTDLRYNETNGITWGDGFAFLDAEEGTLVEGEILHNVPIVEGNNISFVQDTANQVIKINATYTDTDTKNTAGATHKDSTKLFLVGAETVGAHPATYSNSKVYIGTDNCLYSDGDKVVTSIDLGTAVVAEANKAENATCDQNGDVIDEKYATKTALETEIGKILDGTVDVGYALSADYATDATYANEAGAVNVTDTTPTSTTTYYPLYATGTSGKQTVRANKDLYYYDAGTWSYFNVGSNNQIGGLTLHHNNGTYANLATTTLTANRDLTIPDASGTIITTGNFPTASSSTAGGIKVSSINSSAVTVNSESTDTGRYYPVELNKDGKAIVNVPWVDLQAITDLNLRSGSTTSITVDTSGIHWSNSEAEIELSDGGLYVQPTLSNYAPIVAGENIKFDTDNTNKVVKIKADLTAANTYTNTEIAKIHDDYATKEHVTSELQTLYGCLREGQDANGNPLPVGLAETATCLGGADLGSPTQPIYLDGGVPKACNELYSHPTYTARTSKPTANQTPAFGGDATVSQITSDATGHVTGMTDRTITIPSTLSNGTGTAGLIKTSSTVTSVSSSNGYTACPVIGGVPYYKDTKVTQAAAITTAGAYPVLLGYSTATTAVTNPVNKTSTLNYNPSTKVLTAPTFNGALNGNASTASKLANAKTISLTGAVTGSASFDGSKNITITTTSSTGSGTLPDGITATGSSTTTVPNTSTLVGAKWEANDELSNNWHRDWPYALGLAGDSSQSAAVADISFTIEGVGPSYVGMSVSVGNYSSDDYTYITLYFEKSTGASIGAYSYTYNQGTETEGWDGDPPTLHFTGGTAATNTSLINWLKANGTLTFATTTTEIDATLTVDGTITAKSFNATSDARLKKNFEAFSPRASVLDLPVYKFDFIEGPDNQIGCKAQDLQEICPELVVENEDGYLSIKESKIVYLLLAEVKNLQRQIDELRRYCNGI